MTEPAFASAGFARSTQELGIEGMLETEWLLPTGHGGFAMGTALGVNTRRYHGLLVAAARPPVDRVMVLNRIAVEVREAEGDRVWAVGAVLRAGGELVPADVVLPMAFERSPEQADWSYKTDSFDLTVRLRVGLRSNQCVAQYALRANEAPLRFVLQPFFTLRDFHSQIDDPPADRFEVRAIERGAHVSAEGRGASVVTHGMAFEMSPVWERSVVYPHESSRGQPDAEDLFSPGLFTADVQPGWVAPALVTAALDPEEPGFGIDPDDRHQHLDRIAGLARMTGRDLPDVLVAAADDFLVARTVGDRPLTSVIAGYPWFADWGRDTMISLPGLMLVTGRWDAARATLEAYARNVSRGMIPNRFDDYGAEPHYNTIDAPLWFLHAVTEYVRTTGDRGSFDALLGPACREIIECYVAGTRHGIRVDPADHLVMGGDETTQLTWMDAKRDGRVFTPRHGKAVEINALWVHGLRAAAGLVEEGDTAFARTLREEADRAAASLRERFIRPDGLGLYDRLVKADGAWVPSAEIRPNQVFAASLEHGPLTGEERRMVVGVVRDRLLTPYGLRTLDPGDPKYCPRFEGDMMARDRAYHNGTVWPWLIGPYAEAVLRAGGFGEAARSEALEVIAPLVASVETGCLGQVAEVYDGGGDGGGPQREGGCPAQAWSVAELLRVIALCGHP